MRAERVLIDLEASSIEEIRNRKLYIKFRLGELKGEKERLVAERSKIDEALESRRRSKQPTNLQVGRIVQVGRRQSTIA